MTTAIETRPARPGRGEEPRPADCCGRCAGDEALPEEERCERCRGPAPPVGGLPLPGLGGIGRTGDDHRPVGVTPPVRPR